ncbi:aspartate/glutamate racemase family protein [uncultured Anaerococcus sp.]|uniref:aspartate/glutamate racemase family protein n=1 Tax=uncultured Anaerococcus sp. TaxID=293428 RepID=UPI00261C660E|nr:amino acid racemase [uncultured Anaerococcus sp.]
MDRLGVLGGMGPLCTASFYRKLVKYTEANRDQDHIPTMILSDPLMPDRTDAILNGADEKLLLDKAKEDLQTLEKLNVSHIAIPCNTMHFYIDKLKTFTDINIINMVYETIKYCADKNYKNIAVLGTLATINCGIYDKYADEFGINIYKLDDREKTLSMNTIYKIKQTNNTSAPEFLKLVESIKDSDIDALILACTELSLIDSIMDYDFIIDAMDILATESIKKMGYKVKK